MSDACTKDRMTRALPIVPDINMNKYKINVDISKALYGRRKESGYAIGGLFKSKDKEKHPVLNQGSSIS